MELLIIRHTQTIFEDQKEARCIGHTDIPLSNLGISAIEDLLECIQTFKPEVVISSDLERCRRIAITVAKMFDLKVELSAEWRELNFGVWENKSWEEIYKHDQMAYENWVNDFVRIAPKEGESFVELYNRVVLQLKSIIARKEKRVLIVTHAGAIRAAICCALGLPLKNAFAIELSYGSLIHLNYDDLYHWKLCSLYNSSIYTPFTRS